MPRDIAPVSVIIPAYNAGKSIQRALQSVAAQTLPPAEVIVVDDGSNDDTATQARAMHDTLKPSKLIVIEQPNQGAGAARNRAIDAASQKYLAFLDADDEWLPAKLKMSLEILTSNDYTLVAHDYLDVTPNGEVHVSCAERFNEGPDPYLSLYLKGYIPSISVVVRRDVVLAVGGFDESLRNAQDFDLWLKVLADPKTTFTVFDTPLAKYFHTPGGIMTHTERRINCCVQIAYRYLPALRERERDIVPALTRRLTNVYSEAFAVYFRSRKFTRALLIPFRLTLAIAKTGLNANTSSARGWPGLYIGFSVWIVAILGIYLSQFQSLIGPVMNAIKRAVGLA